MFTTFFVYGPRVIFAALWDILYWPLWWYGPGLRVSARSLYRFIARKQAEVSWWTWVRSFFRPLYGDYTLKGRVKSIVARTGQSIIRTAAAVWWIGVGAVGMIAYTIVPVVIVWQILYQLLPTR